MAEAARVASVVAAWLGYRLHLACDPDCLLPVCRHLYLVPGVREARPHRMTIVVVVLHHEHTDPGAG